MFSADLGVTPSSANYIEDVFSTYLYTGNGSTQTITNGIDLSTKGGLVWIKGRADNTDHSLTDTVNGTGKFLSSNTTTAITSNSDNISAFSTTGFTASFSGFGRTNENLKTYASWTFRKQAKFFDVVTYTGNGTNRTIAHNLGSVPGCIIVKCTSDVTDWAVYHRSLTSATNALQLNTTGAQLSNAAYWNSTAPTSTVFSVGTDNDTNGNLRTYVAYLFAHDAGGFGATGSDNVISCGSFTTNGSGAATVTLGYEPQWAMFKSASNVQDWFMSDNMRGMPVGSADAYLVPNLTQVESTYEYISPTATGFTISNQNASATYIYIAIRRGPMKTPTTGTSVFSPIASSAATGTKLTTNFPIDLQIYGIRTGVGGKGQTVDRLRGISTNTTESGALLVTSSTAIESTINIPTLFWDNTGFQMPSSFASSSDIFWNFGRAPGFFDIVCYTGNTLVMNINHNLGAVPEMMIFKNRQSAGRSWPVYTAATGNTQALLLNSSAAVNSTGNNYFNSTSPTSTVFTVNTAFSDVGGTNNIVAYLFATVAGVSKVGSYTGTGTTKQIDCGFTGGARFVLIKRTDSTGDWYVWDSARGIVSGNDSYLLLNSTAAEVTNTDYVDTYSAGFEISSTAPAAINANGGSFIFFAVA